MNTPFDGNPPSAAAPRITVVVCTFNRAFMLGECLRSLERQTLSSSAFTVLVVDNNSGDETRTVAEAWCAGHANRRYLFESRQGLSAARNCGLHHVRTEYVAFIDDDSTAAPDWLEQAGRIIDVHHPDIFGGAVQPLFPADKPPWLREEYAVRGDMGETGWLNEGFIVGTNIFFRTALLREYGGFDPRLGMNGERLSYHEETQLVQRALREKRLVYYSRDLRVWDTPPEYKLSLAYYIYTKYRAGADGVELWRPRFEEAGITDLLKLIDATMEEFQAALRQRDPARHPYPENYLLDTKVLNNFFTIGMMTEYFLRRDKEKP